MEILYKKQNESAFLKHYLGFIKKHKLSLIYLPSTIEYFYLIAKPIDDESFVVIENNQCVGLCHCPIYRINHQRQISNNGGYLPAPIGENPRITKYLFETLDQIAKKHHCSSIYLYYSAQDSTHFVDQKPMCDMQKLLNLKQYGYIDTSSIDTLVCLENTQDQLWSNLRKSYKPLINHYNKKPEFCIHKVTQESPNRAIHDLYVEFHHQCSRRKTRSDESFEIQYQMLLDGYASLFALSYETNFIGFCYFFHDLNHVTYHSGSDDPQFEGSKIPIYHLILWNALCYFQQKKFKTINFSQPSNFTELQGFQDYSDKKQINIAAFKRGMGGGDKCNLFAGSNILILNAS